MNQRTEEPVAEFRLCNAAGLQIRVMELGATWLSCTVPLPDGTRRELLLGCRDLQEYRRQRYYIGAAVGRFSNRIRCSRLVLDGRTVQLLPNEGPNHLHGGPEGFDRRRWRGTQLDAHALELRLVSPAGDQGYPGELDVLMRYRLGTDLALDIEFEARCDAACPVGLTQHAYFNLDGDQGGATTSVLQHTLQVAADHWLPTDDEGLGADELASVGGTGMNLRKNRCLNDAVASEHWLRAHRGFDHSFALRSEDRHDPGLQRPAAVLTSSDGRVRMELATDQPALQVYTGQGLGGILARDGRPYGDHAGIALEPQFLPGSPGREPCPPTWPDCVLRPGAVWRSHTRLRFSVS